jgi:hypothetical protein
MTPRRLPPLVADRDGRPIDATPACVVGFLFLLAMLAGLVALLAK